MRTRVSWTIGALTVFDLAVNLGEGGPLIDLDVLKVEPGFFDDEDDEDDEQDEPDPRTLVHADSYAKQDGPSPFGFGIHPVHTWGDVHPDPGFEPWTEE